jgi:hypothetical protein
MSSSSTSQEYINKWMQEYCAPVVLTITTAETESICLKNGLLLHEMLSAFGHLDGIQSSVRVGNHTFPLPDAHIRFERSTEFKPKSAQDVEDQLGRSFQEFDITRLPNSVSELKANPPCAWSPAVDQIFMRMTSFTEQEMISQPLLILTVVATSDIDHVACLQELSSPHHTAASFSSGQYDPNVARVFLLLHDAGDKHIDAQKILNQLRTRFPAASTRLLTINSVPVEAPNSQQPDMWSRFLLPNFFPAELVTTLPSLFLSFSYRKGNFIAQSLHIHCVFIANSMHSNCAIAAYSVRSDCVIAAHLLRNHCAIIAQSLCNRFASAMKF